MKSFIPWNVKNLTKKKASIQPLSEICFETEHAVFLWLNYFC